MSTREKAVTLRGKTALKIDSNTVNYKAYYTLCQVHTCLNQWVREIIASLMALSFFRQNDLGKKTSISFGRES